MHAKHVQNGVSTIYIYLFIKKIVDIAFITLHFFMCLLVHENHINT